jgi:excisionase family DNA binding protein
MLGQRTGPRRRGAQGWVCGGCGDMEPTMSEPRQQHLFAPDGRLLHAEDVAQILGVPKTWVYAETRAGRLPHVNVGRYRRYRLEAVEEWIAEHERGPIRDRRRSEPEGSRAYGEQRR